MTDRQQRKSQPRSRPFDPAEDERLKELYHEGYNQGEIAERMDRPRSSIRDRGVYLGLDWALKGRLATEFYGDSPLQPIHLTIEPRKTKPLIDNLPFVDVIYGDTHHPFHDPAAQEVLYKLLDLISVDRVFHLGDLVDNWQLSNFIPPDERLLTAAQKDLADQFLMAAQHLGTVAGLTPDAERTLLEGNHEDRWSRMLRKAQQDPRWRHVLGLPRVQEALRLPSLLGTASAGFEYYNYRENVVPLNKHMVLTHGNRTTKWAARAMLEQYGRSVIFGDTHRVQNYVKRDMKATEAAWNIGCMCDLNPHYGDQNAAIDWAQGFALVIHDDHHSVASHFNVIQLRIHWGICVTPWGTIKA